MLNLGSIINLETEAKELMHIGLYKQVINLIKSSSLNYTNDWLLIETLAESYYQLKNYKEIIKLAKVISLCDRIASGSDTNKESIIKVTLLTIKAYAELGKKRKVAEYYKELMNNRESTLLNMDNGAQYYAELKFYAFLMSEHNWTSSEIKEIYRYLNRCEKNAHNFEIYVRTKILEAKQMRRQFKFKEARELLYELHYELQQTKIWGFDKIYYNNLCNHEYSFS